MRVFISQASRNAAHNLDDLSERWQLRKEREKYSVWIPPGLPIMNTIAEIMLFRAELLKIRMGIDTELGMGGKHAENREQLLKWGKHIQTLQIQSKARLEELEKKNGGTEIVMLKTMIRKGLLIVEGMKDGYALTFPTLQQRVIIPKQDLSEGE